MARKPPQNDRLRDVRMHPGCGHLACFFTFGTVPRTSEMFRGCSMYQRRLRSRGFVSFFYLSKGVEKVRGLVEIAISIKNGWVPSTRAIVALRSIICGVVACA